MIAREISLAGTGNRPNHAIRSDPPDALVICYVDRTGTVNGYAIRMIQQRGGCRSAVAGVAGIACACNGGDDSIRADAADSVVVTIRDVEDAVLVHRNAVRGG